MRHLGPAKVDTHLDVSTGCKYCAECRCYDRVEKIRHTFVMKPILSCKNSLIAALAFKIVLKHRLERLRLSD